MHGFADASDQEEVQHCIPYIGVMCIDLSLTLEPHFGRGVWHSYLAASYVKHLEASGAMVIPIWIGREREYYVNIMSQLNGMLLPGGAVYITADDDDPNDKKWPEITNDCVETAAYIYEIAMEMNDRGQYFPVWGTCLGFQLLMINAAQSSKVRTDCQGMFEALPVQLSEDYKDSVIFKQLSPEMAEQMLREPFACHHHRYCITEDHLRRYPTHKDWRILATNVDGAQKRFITLIEHARYPIFGCQFHPEKGAYEQLFARKDSCSAAHTTICIQLNRYFADVFVDACRRNRNHFASVELKASHMIYNWQPVFSGQFNNTHWLQCYLFGKNEDYPKTFGNPMIQQGCENQPS